MIGRRGKLSGEAAGLGVRRRGECEKEKAMERRGAEAIGLCELEGFSEAAVKALDRVLENPEAFGWTRIEAAQGLKGLSKAEAKAKGTAQAQAPGKIAGARRKMGNGRELFAFSRGGELVVSTTESEYSTTSAARDIAKGDTEYMSGNTALAVLRAGAKKRGSPDGMFRELGEKEAFDRMWALEGGADLLAGVAEGLARGAEAVAAVAQKSKEAIFAVFRKIGAPADRTLRADGLFLKDALEALEGAGIGPELRAEALSAAAKGAREECSLGAEDTNAKLDFLFEKASEANLEAAYGPDDGRSQVGIRFNDHDNGVATLRGRLLFWSQNVEFLAERNKAGGWDVFASGEYAPVESAPKLADALDAGAAVEPAFSFSGTEVLKACSGWEECFELDLRYSCMEMSELYGGEPKVPVDVRTYRYQLAYALDHYPTAVPNRAAFLVQAFATLGGGFEMDEKGRLFDSSARYDAKAARAAQEPLGAPGELDEERLCLVHPDLLSGLARKKKTLSPDWAEALAEFKELLSKKLESGFEARKDLGISADYDPRKVLAAAEKTLALGVRVEPEAEPKAPKAP